MKKHYSIILVEQTQHEALPGQLGTVLHTMDMALANRVAGALVPIARELVVMERLTRKKTRPARAVTVNSTPYLGAKIDL